MPRSSPLLPDNYDEFLGGLKQRIRSAQVRAALAVNEELIILYWEIGRAIAAQQQSEGWGSKVINRLAQDLKTTFPDMKGLSARNLGYMRAFAAAYPDREILQRCVAKLPWRHNIALLEKLKGTGARLWYGQQAIEQGWSRDILVMQIETQLYERQGNPVNNFERTLPVADSDLARQLLKDPYHFEFLSLSQAAQERDIENALLAHIKDFLLELGVGFAFLGSQYQLTVDDRDYYIDLLFYHVKLHCYVVIELKVGEFTPSHSGQLNFYVSAVDNLLRAPEDRHTIGIILCRSKSDMTVEYALQDIQKPIGVATYLLREDLPEGLQESLPTREQLEMELETAIEIAESQED